MKICITGGAGFIGSHLANELLKQGHSVTVADSFARGNAGDVDKGAKMIKCDVRDAKSLKEIIDGYDAVFHLAAQTDVRLSLENPDLDYAINFTGTNNVLEAAYRSGSHIAFTSSCAVYGNCNEPAFEEKEANPLSQYAWNKLHAESLLPKSAFIARLFNVYGPRGNSFVNTACNAAAKGGAVNIFGSGLQTRDYVHVDDVVAALIKGLKLKGIYNIGTGKEASVLSVVHVTENATGKDVEMIFRSPIEGEIERSVADIGKMQEEGWEPKTTLTEGVRRLCRTQKQASSSKKPTEL